MKRILIFLLTALAAFGAELSVTYNTTTKLVAPTDLTIVDGIMDGDWLYTGTSANNMFPSGAFQLGLRYVSGATGEVFAAIQTVPNFATLSSSVSSFSTDTNRTVTVLGYYAANDGGGGEFYYIPHEAADDGITFDAASASYSWRRIWDGSTIYVRWFGAKGDGVTDDSAAIQAAIDAMVVLNPLGTVALGAGDFLASNLELRGITLTGNGTLAPRGSPTTIYQPDGDTNDVIHTPGSAQVQGKVIGIRFQGAKDHSIRYPRNAITAVTSRTLFTVATNALPTASPNVAAWPFYGYAFFRSSEGRYIGSAIVQSVDTGTGEVTINANSDWYATPTGSGNLLDTTCTVVFSPVTVSGLEPVIANSTNNSPASAGSAAIRIIGSETATVQDCSISGFHVGIVLDTAVRPIIQNVWISACDFAGISAEAPSKYYDLDMSGVFVQGFYSADYLSSAETNSFDNALYRRTTHGLWTGGKSSVISDLSIDATVLPWMANEEQDVAMKYLMLDQPVDSGIWSRGQPSPTSGVQIDNLFVRSSVNSAVTAGPGTNVNAAVRLSGATERWRFGTVSLPYLVAGNNYDYAFEISQTTARPSVRSFGTLTGVDAVNNTGSSGYTTLWVDDASSLLSTSSTIATGFYRPALGELAHYAGTTNVWSSSTSGTLHPRPLGVGPAASLVTSNILDVAAHYIRVGSDELSNLTRTDATRKDGGLSLFGYDAADKDTALIYAFNDTASAGMFLGLSGGSDPRNTLTLFRVYGAATKTGTPALWFNAASSGVSLGSTNIPVSVTDTVFGLGRMGTDVGSVDGQTWYREDIDRVMVRINGTNNYVAVVTPDGLAWANGVGMKLVGWSSISIPAGSFVPAATSGATAVAATAYATNGFTDDLLLFPDASDTYADRSFNMPIDYDGTTALKFNVSWFTTATANSAIFGVSALWVRNGDSPSATLGTEVTVTDAAQGTASYQSITDTSGSVTPGGTYAEGCRLLLRLHGDGDGWSLTSDAYVNDFTLFYKTKSVNTATP